MGLRSASWIVVIGATVSLAHVRPGQVWADDPAASPSDLVARLVEQLDAPRFADREAASEKLAALGRTTIPALSKAAASKSAEASARAIDLLRKLLESIDPSTGDAAKIALEALAKNDRQTLAPAPGGPAGQAGGAKADDTATGSQRVFSRRGDPDRRAGRGAYDFHAERQRSEGGRCRRDRPENQDPRRSAEGNPDRSDEQEERQGRHGEVRSERCRGAEEEAPEGHKIYELYGKNQGGLGGIQLQIQGGAGPMFRMPVLPGNFPIPQVQPFPGNPFPANLEEHQVRTAALLLKNAGMQLDRLRQEQWKQVPETAREELKKQLAAMKRQMADLEQRLPVKDVARRRPPQPP